MSQQQLLQLRKKLGSPSPVLAQQAVVGLFSVLSSQSSSTDDRDQAISACLCHPRKVAVEQDGCAALRGGGSAI